MKAADKKQLDAQQQFLQHVAQMLDGIFNPPADEVEGMEGGEIGKTGFGLMIFTPGAISGSHVNWVSNCERPDMRSAMQELLDRWSAQDTVAATVRRNLQ